MKLLIGCPTYKRTWILPHWVRCLVTQSVSMADVGFVFEVSPDDEQTMASLDAWRRVDSKYLTSMLK